MRVHPDHLDLHPLCRPLLPHYTCPSRSGYPFARMVDDPDRRALRPFRDERKETTPNMYGVIVQMIGMTLDGP